MCDGQLQHCTSTPMCAADIIWLYCICIGISIDIFISVYVKLLPKENFDHKQYLAVSSVIRLSLASLWFDHQSLLLTEYLYDNTWTSEIFPLNVLIDLPLDHKMKLVGDTMTTTQPPVNFRWKKQNNSGGNTRNKGPMKGRIWSLE